MPKRDQRLYIEDILDSAEAIKEFKYYHYHLTPQV